MTDSDGYNPLRWDCEKRQCWNLLCRPNIEYFARVLPRNIGMTDIDGSVEVNKHFLFLEWKSFEGDIPVGQRLYFERLTKVSKDITCVIVFGTPHPMNVQKICTIWDGKLSAWEACDLVGLIERVGRWAAKAEGRPYVSASALEAAE